MVWSVVGWGWCGWLVGLFVVLRECSTNTIHEGDMFLHIGEELAVCCMPSSILLAKANDGFSKEEYPLIGSLVCLIVALLVCLLDLPLVNHVLSGMAFDLGDEIG